MLVLHDNGHTIYTMLWFALILPHDNGHIIEIMLWFALTLYLAYILRNYLLLFSCDFTSTPLHDQVRASRW